MPPSQPTLPQLFNTSHVRPGLAAKLILAMYFPLGLMLLCLRLLFLLPTLLLLVLVPPTFIPPLARRLLCAFFGIVDDPVTQRSLKPPIRRSVIYASNHCTTFDGLSFFVSGQLDMLVDKEFFEASWIARSMFRTIGALPLDKSSSSPEHRAKVREGVAAHVKSAQQPLLFFPEGWDTNGKAGLLLYQKYLFSLGVMVQPVALRVRVPLLPLEPSKLGTTVVQELLWLFFSPCYHYHLTYFPPLHKHDHETEVDFARRTQELTATFLGVCATNWTDKDALRYRRQLLSPEKKLM